MPSLSPATSCWLNSKGEGTKASVSLGSNCKPQTITSTVLVSCSRWKHFIKKGSKVEGKRLQVAGTDLLYQSLQVKLQVNYFLAAAPLCLFFFFFPTPPSAAQAILNLDTKWLKTGYHLAACYSGDCLHTLPLPLSFIKVSMT